MLMVELRIDCGVLDTNLRILPENPRYFQYRGLPTVLFWGTHHWGWNSNPTPEELEYTASYANYITIQATNFRSGEDSTYPRYWDRINDDSHWKAIQQSVEWALERDILVYLYHYDGYGLGKYHHMDWLLRNPDNELFDRDLEEFGLPGVTSRDIHERVIEQTVKYLSDYPNVVYDMCFEIKGTIRHGRADHRLIKWWNNRLQEVGNDHNPDVDHLVTSMYGGSVRDDYDYCEIMHPSEWDGDFITGQSDAEGFFPDPDEIPEEVFDFEVPMVRMALEYVFNDDDFLRIDFDDYEEDPYYHLIRKQIGAGIHSAEPYGGKSWQDVSSPVARSWYRQLRFYLETVETWDDEPGDEITQDSLPEPTPGERPVALNPPEFEHGHRINDAGVTFGLIYTHPDGTPPSRVEVWVDRNGDGRYNPSPEDAERIAMTPDGDDFEEGVEYRVEGVIPTFESEAPLSYIFRVGDEHWKPAAPGGVIPENTSSISYRSWETQEVSADLFETQS